MKTLQDYITEAQQWIDRPVPGDDFGINIREECLLESWVVEADDERVVIEADERMLALLDQYGMLTETDQETPEITERIARYGAVGNNRAMGFTREDMDPQQHLEASHRDADAADDIDETQEMRRIRELSGVTETEVDTTDPLADKAAALAPVGADSGSQHPTTVDETSDFRRVMELAGIPEEREDREWSNRELEALNRAARDFERHLDSVSTPDDRAFNANLVKKRMAKNPLAGPKDQLPEQQGVAEDYYVSKTHITPNKYYLMSKDGKHLFGDPDSGAGYDDPMEFDSLKDLLTFFRNMQDKENFDPVMYNGKTLQYVNGQGVAEGSQDNMDDTQSPDQHLPRIRELAGLAEASPDWRSKMGFDMDDPSGGPLDDPEDRGLHRPETFVTSQGNKYTYILGGDLYDPSPTGDEMSAQIRFKGIDHVHPIQRIHLQYDPNMQAFDPEESRADDPILDIWLKQQRPFGNDEDSLDDFVDRAVAHVLRPPGSGPDQQDVAEGVMSDIDMDLRHIAKTQRMDALVSGLTGDFGPRTSQYLHDMMDEVDQELERRGPDAPRDIKTRLRMLLDRIREQYDDADLEIMEAEYQGRKVPLGKPMRGDVKKFKVYVRDPKTGNVKKVNFGDKTMRIKKSNPARRRSFRARHNCANPGPRTKARYWACRSW